MKLIKAVGVKELKNNLSAYLREIKRGTTILVTDRNVVVAELREPSFEASQSHDNPILQSWVEKGWVHLPTKPKSPLGKSEVRLPDGTGKRMLDLERGE